MINSKSDGYIGGVSMKYNYDYSQTLWMKLFMAKPDFPNHKSEVYFTFEQALDVIKTVDCLTQGIKKIVYLVGWQGLGHDDCYPEMEVVNEFLKRDCDKTASESLYWLFEEAKKYNTVVSFHGNVADEYGNNASHREIVEANAVANGIDGKPSVIEIFNGRDAYKISYKQYYESGLFKKYFDRFVAATPVREAGTVHLDNFCIAESLNPRTDVYDQNDARNKMIDYITSLGIDVTSEYTYRELPLRADAPDHPIRKLYSQLGEPLPEESWTHAPIHTLGRIAAAWWLSNLTMEDCMKLSPKEYCGRFTDRSQLAVFYGALHGEDIWMRCGRDETKWVPEYLREFCLSQLPYCYLNRYDRVRYEEDDSLGEERYTVYFSDGVVSKAHGGVITKNGIAVKEGTNALLPIDTTDTVFMAYSADGKDGEWNIPDARFTSADVYEVTASGNRFVKTVNIVNGKVDLSVKAGGALAIKGKKA